MVPLVTISLQMPSHSCIKGLQLKMREISTVKSSILYFVPTACLCKECLQNVNLQPVLWLEIARLTLCGTTYAAIPTTAKHSHTVYQNSRLRVMSTTQRTTLIPCLLLSGPDQRETSCLTRVEAIATSDDVST